MHPLLPPLSPADLADPVRVGFSGGLDSTVLLHWLASQPALGGGRLRALHVDHGLQPAAAGWAGHCAGVAAGLGVELAVVRVQVQLHGQGLEAAARDARRAAFAAALEPGERLALAHHLDDQAETFLLRALRGSGADGLAAMRMHDHLGPHRLWRPLLAVPRCDLLAYARAHGLAWIEDPSNAGDDMDRNYLRHQVMPLLARRFPQAGRRLALSASRCADDAALLQDADARALARVRVEDHLSVPGLLSLPATARARVLRRWLRLHPAPPLPGHLHAVLDAQVLPCPADRAACLAWQGWELRRWRDGLHLLPPRPAPPLHWQVDWDGRAPLALPDGRHWQLTGAEGFARPLQVRLRRGGERLQLPGRAHHTALKDCLQQASVPPWQRPWLPLLLDGGTLLAAGTGLYAAGFAPPLVAAGATLQWRGPATD